MSASGPSIEHVFDLHRMFIGDLPWTFTLEIVVRTIIMYTYTLVFIRQLRKRAVGQLSMVEFLLVIAISSAVGDPMFYPRVPLLHGMAVVAVVVLLNRGIDELTVRSERADSILRGRATTLATDGRIDREGIRRAKMSRDELFELLRTQSVEHLGQVREAYMEKDGTISVLQASPDQQRPGLRVTPPWELHEPSRRHAGDRAEHPGHLGCERCGEVQRFETGRTLPQCPRCGHETWVDAVVGATEA